MVLTRLGWSDQFARELDSGLQPARVVSGSRGLYQVWMEDGLVAARIPGSWTAERPVTGDWAGVETPSNMIRTLLPRRSKVSRKKAGRVWEEQVLAANVDVLFLVSALDRDFNVRRLERYLIVANESGAAPVVVLNKADLCEEPLEAFRQVDRIAPNVAVVVMSAFDHAAVAQLHRYMEPAQTAALLGSSGVGKSTIVNSLLESEQQSTRQVREHDSRGRHSTTGRHLFLLEQGWLLIDTPGLRELEPWAGADATAAVFQDVEAFSDQCRFRDCLHQGEPGCAVEAAIAAGTLEPSRLESFRKLHGELAHLERMQNIHAAQEEKRKWKIIHKAMRHHPKHS